MEHGSYGSDVASGSGGARLNFPHSLEHERAVRNDAIVGRIPGRDEQSGWAFPGGNWAGPGFAVWASGRTRPRNVWDFAAKLHDFHYYRMDLAFRFGRPYEDPLWQSRLAKADYVFREMVRVRPPSWGSFAWLQWRGARETFFGRGRDEFVAGDGFVNLLAPGAEPAMDDPEQYLMIPFVELPAGQLEALRAKARAVRRRRRRPGPRSRRSVEPAYERFQVRFGTTVRADAARSGVAGWRRWARRAYGEAVWAGLSSIDGATGPG